MHTVRRGVLTCATIVLLTLSAPAMAQALAGTWRCLSYNVSGGGGSCHTMPSLLLQADGRYTLGSESGNWLLRDGKLWLSESKLRGLGTLVQGDLVFEYDYHGWHHVLTYRCGDCAMPASTH